MHYIVGLGNPGEKYERTRHNVGFTLLQHFVQEAGLPELHLSKSLNSMTTSGVYQGKEIAVLLPQTYMNESGGAVKKLVPQQEAENLLVVYDDIDIPVGQMKISYGRGDGGHNGIKSIIRSLGTKDFVRVRVGICGKSMWTGKPIRPTGDALPKYVLRTFSKKEEQELQSIKTKMSEVIAQFVAEGKEAIMNAHN